ncbi:FliA/WhiG family RNA polymerase sigma factor [Evansella cellulosilytica]|uniref:RNA polymerase, sigma 28 subunit, FliA/WhiG n=1 Tax=Evansella cellulosilytica (strain ATCC 21833 / DSM 2522 / FERM P-1141 / JCM 9156 / N-4) TaxID=649639 RepID=E6TST9_EVAC2|nr:FliA/WhiG family RNA polymerase sigma factor [Evansella cellulosilytica]ADU30731.1 RNA polymerase, sigma 28 subunit, FliA/WhiG [Evansella cellulosilytica DSM 2522]
MPQINATKQLQHDWSRWSEDRDEVACDRLVQAYLPLVDYHVQRIGANLPRNVQLDDLRSNGMLGLYDALEKFDEKRELKFDTYASFRIRGAIIDGLRQMDWLPRSVREKTKKIDQATEKLEQQYGRYVNPKEVADYLGMNEEDVYKTINESYLAHQLSIDEPAQDSEKEDSFTATIMDEKTLTPEQHIDKKGQMEELAEIIKTFNEKEQLIISLFYFEELTLTEIGEILNVSTSRVSQIHSKTIFKLQQKLLSK